MIADELDNEASRTMSSDAPEMLDEDENLRERCMELRKTEFELKAVSKEKQKLEAKRKQLREKIRVAVLEAGGKTATVRIAGEKAVLRLRRSEIIEYDEEKLRSRLGNRYASILKFDKKKAAKWDGLEKALEPHIASVGSPDLETIKKQAELGNVSREEFDGAFTRTKKATLYVSFRAAPPQSESTETP